MDNQDFVNFLNSYNENYLIPVSRISKSFTTQGDSLIENQFKMYSLDDICKDCSILKSNLPKTTDAIAYKIEESGEITFYIIEFKFFNMDSNRSSYVLLETIHNSLKKKNMAVDKSDNKLISNSLLKKYELVKRNFVDSVEFSLRLKPFETIMIALPILYEDYCSNLRDCSKKDFRNFLNNINIKLVIFVNKTAPHTDIVNDRYKVHSITNALKHQYDRLKIADVICEWQIKAAHQFDEFIMSEELVDN